jgi:hypothetical protein
MTISTLPVAVRKQLLAALQPEIVFRLRRSGGARTMTVKS